MRTLGFWLAFLLLLGLAGTARFYDLGLKPFHADEANQAVKFAELLENGSYQYDPHDHHGPTLYYLSLPVAWASGVEKRTELTEAILRILPAFFGVALLLPLLFFRDAVGRLGVLVAAGLLAVSPVLVYYSRYFVQESLLVFFTLLFLGFLWRYVKAAPSFRLGWACALGLSAGLMHATKETFVLHLAAALIALPFMGPVDWKRLMMHIPAAAICAVAVSVVFFSSFFTHWDGVVDSVMTYVHMFDRSGGQGHEKPFSYYADLLWWWEQDGFRLAGAALIVLFLLGAGVALLRRGAGAFFVVYGVVLFAIYSAIEYKTPWLAMNFIPPLALGAAAVWGERTESPLRALVLLPLVGLACWDFGQQTWESSFEKHSDPVNPLAYTQTVYDVERWTTDRLAGENGLDALQDGLRMHVVHPNPWPLPWTFRDRAVGYWQAVPTNVPTGGLDADIILVAAEEAEALDAVLAGEYGKDYFDLRLEETIQVRVRDDLWMRHIDPDNWALDLGPWRHKAMASDWQIHLVHTNEAEAAGAAQAAFEEVDRLEQLLSSYIESSDVKKIERAPAGKPVVVAPETMACLQVAEAMRMESDGLFDVAYATRGVRPVFELNPKTLEVTPTVDGVVINLGGIGKGFALDHIAEFLRDEYGVDTLLVDAASTALAVGDRAWVVGISGRRIALRDQAMSASGTAVKGTHIVDPKTGEAVPEGGQVWSFAPTAAEADARSTAEFLRRSEQDRE